MVLACFKLAKAEKRVLLLDVDAHHGDGVQSAFYKRKDVMTVSLHETGRTLFPGAVLKMKSVKDRAGDTTSMSPCHPIRMTRLF